MSKNPKILKSKKDGENDKIEKKEGQKDGRKKKLKEKDDRRCQTLTKKENEK